MAELCRAAGSVHTRRCALFFIVVDRCDDLLSRFGRGFGAHRWRGGPTPCDSCASPSWHSRVFSRRRRLRPSARGQGVGFTVNAIAFSHSDRQNRNSVPRGAACCAPRDVEPGRMGRCHHMAAGGQCHRFQRVCPVACGHCILCTNHPLCNTYEYDAFRATAASLPPPPPPKSGQPSRGKEVNGA